MENTENIQKTFTGFPTTKKGQELFVQQIIDETLSPDADVIGIFTQIKSLEKIIKAFTESKDVKSKLLNRIERIADNTKRYVSNNVEYQIREVGSKIDYSNCNDPVWNKLKENEEILKAAIKAREEILKHHNGVWIYTDEETGEISTINPSARSSETQVVISIK